MEILRKNYNNKKRTTNVQPLFATENRTRTIRVRTRVCRIRSTGIEPRSVAPHKHTYTYAETKSETRYRTTRMHSYSDREILPLGIAVSGSVPFECLYVAHHFFLIYFRLIFFVWTIRSEWVCARVNLCQFTWTFLLFKNRFSFFFNLYIFIFKLFMDRVGWQLLHQRFFYYCFWWSSILSSREEEK